MNRAHARTPVLAALAVLAAAVLPRACTRRPVAERTAAPSPAAVEHLRPAVVDPDFRAAEPAEVRAALARAFGPSVEATSAWSAVGDFNGDGAPDLAVAVRAVPGHVSDLNDGLANWTVQDCAPLQPPSALPAHARPRPLVRDEEPLVAIVHGLGARGWRDPDARQAYLLKNAGTPEKARPRRDSSTMEDADGPSSGHVLATERGRERGVVYWTGVRYRFRSDGRVGR